MRLKGSKLMWAAFVVCFFFSLVPARGQTGITYITNNGAITVTGYTASAAIVVPDTIGGYPVTSIADNAFANDLGLSSVSIGSNVTNIGSGVFQGNSTLLQITVSYLNPFFSFANGFLYDKIHGTLVVYPPSLSYGNPFAIPTSVTNIADFACEYCHFYGVSIPSTVTNIGNSPFLYCGSLTNFTVDPANGYFSSTNAILFDKSGAKLLAYPEAKSDKYYNIPLGVTNIATNALFHCPNLTNVTITSNVTFIGNGAFSACTHLTAISVDPQNGYYSSTNGVLYDKAGLSLITYPSGETATGFLVPTNIVSIENSAFSSCASLTTVTIPDSVTSIGDYAFQNCGLLTKATIGNGVTNIGNSCFTLCSSLATVVLGNHIANIGNSAFLDCHDLTNIVIPDGVTNIGNQAFADCTSVTNVSLGSGIIIIGSEAFLGCGRLVSIVLPNSVTSIGSGAFGVCGVLSSITMPASITNIGSTAFDDCYHLTNVYFMGNAPVADSTLFLPNDTNLTFISYLPGASGWGATFAGIPTTYWLPAILTGSKGSNDVGLQSNQFGFTVSWASNQSIVVQASTNLLNPVWTPVITNSLTNGVYQFSDPSWTNYPSRFYRVSSL